MPKKSLGGLKDGKGKVVTSPDDVFFSDSAGFKSSWHSVFRPRNIEELMHYLRDRRSTGASNPPLYSVSVGYNWGLGSKIAPTQNCVLVELGELRTIRCIDTKQGYAIVEPGVSQAALAAKLKGSQFLLNCTTSSSKSSIVGNLMDRGIGTRRSKADDLLGLEVLLPNGETLITGFMPRGLNQAACKHNLGPSTLDLFSQSNLGIVTAATISLIPRAEAIFCLKITALKSEFSKLVDEMRYCQLQGLASGLIKIYDSKGFSFYGAIKPGDYNAYVFFEGPIELAKASAEFVNHRISTTIENCTTKTLDPLGVIDDPAEKALISSFCGDPSFNDAMIQTIFGVPAHQVDTSLSRRGWLFFLPLVPSCSYQLSRAVNIIEEVASRSSLNIGYTLNLMPAGYTDLVISIRFDRLSECTQAHSILSRLHQDFAHCGYYPYRLDIGHMDVAREANGNHSNNSLIRGIKNILDPDHQLSPGRYEWL